MKITNKHGLPEPVVRALTFDDYTRGEAEISVTQIIDSPRVRILRGQHFDEIEEDVSEMTWAVLGRAVHVVMEQGATEQAKFTPEERYFVEVEGWKLSGAIDLQEHGAGVWLRDYKCTSVWSVIFGKPDWELQLNVYAYLIEQTQRVRVDGLSIIAILRDWQRKKAAEDPSYPQAPIMEIEVKLWTPEERDEYVKERVRLHQDAEFKHLMGEPLPPCSDKDRWLKESKYAVRKPKNKRALRVFSSMEDAEKYMASLDHEAVIDERPGEAIRCEQNWCRVAEWCDQYQESKA